MITKPNKVKKENKTKKTRYSQPTCAITVVVGIFFCLFSALKSGLSTVKNPASNTMFCSTRLTYSSTWKTKRFIGVPDANQTAAYSAANDPRPQMPPRPEMIPKLDRKGSWMWTINDPVGKRGMAWDI